MTGITSLTCHIPLFKGLSQNHRLNPAAQLMYSAGKLIPLPCQCEHVFFIGRQGVVFVEIHRSSHTNQNLLNRFYVTPEVLAACMLSSYLKICHQVPVEQH